MNLENYEVKEEFAIDSARDLLRSLNKYGSDENCKKLCSIAKVIFE